MRFLGFFFVTGPAVLLACLAGACSASGSGAAGDNGSGNGNGSSGSGGDNAGGSSLPPSSSGGGGPGSSADGGPPGPGAGGADAATADGSTIVDASKPDTYVPPGGAGVTITIDGMTIGDPTTTMRRNTAVGGGSGGSDGTSYVSTDLGATPQDALFMLQINSQTNYITVGDYPCGSAQSPSAGQSFLELDFLSEPGGKAWDSVSGTCTVHVATVSGAVQPHVTGTITGLMRDIVGGTTANVTGTFDVPYSN